MKTGAILTALLTQLATIRPANGYHTDAGLRVHRLLLGMPLPEALVLPALWVRLDGATVEASNRMARLDTRETLSLVIECAVAINNTTPPDQALLELLWDVRAALAQESALVGLLHGLEGLTLDAASFRLPEGGASLAVVIQPVTLRFAERYALN